MAHDLVELFAFGVAGQTDQNLVGSAGPLVDHTGAQIASRAVHALLGCGNFAGLR